MDWIQDSSTYQANSVIVATEEYIILNMHLIFTLDTYLSKSIFISIAFSFIQLQIILYLLSSIMITNENDIHNAIIPNCRLCKDFAKINRYIFSLFTIQQIIIFVYIRIFHKQA